MQPWQSTDNVPDAHNTQEFPNQIRKKYKYPFPQSSLDFKSNCKLQEFIAINFRLMLPAHVSSKPKNTNPSHWNLET